MSGARKILLVVLAASAGACAAASRGADRTDVELLAGDRIGKEISLGPGDVETDDLDQLLAAPLDPDRAVQIALARSPETEAALAELGVARAALVQAALPQNPVLEGEARFRDNGEDPAIELSLTQNLTDFIYLARRAGARDAEIEAAKLRATGAILDFVFRVRTAFYRHQADLQRLELWRTVHAAAAASFEAAVALHEAGNVTDLTYYGERDLLEQAKLAVADAETRVQRGRERFSAMLGLWGPGARWSVAGRLHDPAEEALDLAEIERTAVEKSVDLQAARQRIAGAGARAGLARARGFFPGLEVGVAAHTEEPGVWEVGPRIELALPLFDQGQAASAFAGAELSRLERRAEADAIRLRAAARSAAVKVMSAAARARHYRDVMLPLRRHLLEETQAGVNAMTLSVFQLLQSKRAQISAARDYVTALESYWLARAELDQILRGRMIEPAISGVGGEVEAAGPSGDFEQLGEGGH